MVALVKFGDVNEDKVRNIFDKAARTFSDNIHKQFVDSRPDVRIGVCTFSISGQAVPIKNIISNANLARKRAKQPGMPRIIFYDEQMGFDVKSDDYRVPYAVYVESHPRKSILVGTTNSSDGFLRDTEGNRRFWPVVCSGDTPEETKPWNLTDEEIDLLWAEAVHYYRAKEPLHLDGEMAAAAKQMQQTAMEQDPRLGQTEEYLKLRVPREWIDYPLQRRLKYLQDYTKMLRDLKTYNPYQAKFANLYDECTPREYVSRIEIWVECYGRKQELFNQKESTRITALLKSLGWQQAGYASTEAYGRQRIFTPPQGWREKVQQDYETIRAYYDSYVEPKEEPDDRLPWQRRSEQIGAAFFESIMKDRENR